MKHPVDYLFPAAKQAREDWSDFPWHKHNGVYSVSKPQSSQALAIDVFGTIASRTPKLRDAILNRLASTLGIPGSTNWKVLLEFPVKRELLGEPRPTQIDVLAESADIVIAFECKFTEGGGGCCSQTRPYKGNIQCSGRYEHQTNPVNALSGRCALTAKGIR